MDRRKSCFELATDIVDGVGQYMNHYSSYRATGYILTSALVECIYHVVPEYRDRSSPVDKRETECTLRKAGDLLKDLSRSVGPASRALHALECVLSSDETQTTSLSGYQPIQHLFDGTQNWTDKFWDVAGSGQIHDPLGEGIEEPALSMPFGWLESPAGGSGWALADNPQSYASGLPPVHSSGKDIDNPYFELNFEGTTVN